MLGPIYGPKDLAAGASETFTIKYKVKSTDPDPLPNTARITSNSFDPNQGNDEASWLAKMGGRSPVGGLLMPVDKLKILTPYLALVGLVAAASATVLVKKRRED